MPAPDRGSQPARGRIHPVLHHVRRICIAFDRSSLTESQARTTQAVVDRMAPELERYGASLFTLSVPSRDQATAACARRDQRRNQSELLAVIVSRVGDRTVLALRRDAHSVENSYPGVTPAQAVAEFLTAQTTIRKAPQRF